VEGLRALLKGARAASGGMASRINDRCRTATWPPMLRALRSVGLDHYWADGQPLPRSCRAMIVARLMAPVSKLATAKALDRPPPPPVSQCARLGAVDEDELYTALELVASQPAGRSRRARTTPPRRARWYLRRHVELSRRALLPLAQRGYIVIASAGKLQIVYGLLVAPRRAAPSP